MKQYTFVDLQDANLVLEDEYTLMGNGDRLYPIELVQWAKKVKRWFNALYTIARLYKRAWKMHWTLALKAVWQYVRSVPFAGKLFSLLRWVTNKARTRMRANGAVNDVIVSTSYVSIPRHIRKESWCGKSRSAKSNKAIRYRAMTEQLEHRFGNGQWSY